MVTSEPTARPQHELPATRQPGRGRALLDATVTLHRPLLGMVALMAGLAVVCLGGLLVDDRMLLGESVWVKPLKFALAFGVYGLTLAWLLSLPHKGSRATWWLGVVFAITGVLDVGVIALQAARGSFSHFNNLDTDPVNQFAQRVFMSGVPGLFLASVLIMLILSWQRLLDRPTARAIHAGLALAVAAMAIGYLMGFTGKQLVHDSSGQLVELIAGHTVLPDGSELVARDGLPGMPLTHWSTVGGDLRIPHFVGLHAIQALLLAVVVLAKLAPRYPWLRDERARARVIGVLALGCAATLWLVLWQALRAQPLVHPDGLTLALFGGLVLAVAGLLRVAYLRSREDGEGAHERRTATTS
ncbi:hypothetical protein [Nocardia callitridis]|uniref:Uncharacterized protein n=1 Tax=Nocardia callitridis TaxID=648753 RepID=A0ABP9K701_9NOCA